MKNNTIDHPTLNYKNLIKKIKLSKNFDDILICIKYNLKYKYHECEELLILYKNLFVKNNIKHSYDEFFELISKVYIDISIVNEFINQSEIVIPENGVGSKKHALEFIEDISKYYEKLDSYRDKYSWFKGALVLGPILELHYNNEENPGVIIGKYINILFNDDKVLYCDKVSKNLYENNYFYNIDEISKNVIHIPENSCIHKLLILITEYILQTHFKNNELIRLFFDTILNTKKYRKDYYAIENILYNINSIPECLAVHWIIIFFTGKLNDYCDYRSLSLKSLHYILSEFEIGYFNIDQCLHNKDIMKYYENRKNCGISRLISKKFDYYFLNELFSVYIYDGDTLLDKKNNKCLRFILKKYTFERLQINNGISLIHDIDCCDIYKFINYYSDLDFNEIDITIALIAGYRDYDFLNALDIEGNDDIYDFNYKYTSLFKNINEEGMCDLSCALYSVYLLSITLSTCFRLINLKYIKNTIEHGLSVCGSRSLYKTISIIYNHIKNSNHDENLNQSHKIIEIYFENLLNKYKSIDKDIDIKKYRNNKNCENEIIEIITPERWIKLSPQSKKYLSEATFQWNVNAIYYGSGINEWSGLVVLYCKVIENELLLKYSNVFNNTEFKNYCLGNNIKIGDKMTGGNVCYFLRKYKKMPEEIKIIFDKTNSTIHCNKELINDIYDLIQNYRNVAAHNDPLGIVKFAEFRVNFFKTVNKFIDCIS